MEHDIKFKRKETRVQLAVDTDLPYDEENNTILYFYYDCEDLDYAELLCRYFEKRHKDAIRAIRKAEYESGWRDAKGKKRRKSNWFSDMMYQESNNSYHE